MLYTCRRAKIFMYPTRNNICFHPNRYVLLSPLQICSTSNYVKLFEVPMGTSLNICTLHGDTAVTTTEHMYIL